MPFYLPTKNVGAGAPEVEDGLAIVRFDDIFERKVDQFITESDRYGKTDDGFRLELQFTLVDKDFAVLYQEEGDPIVLRNAKAIKHAGNGGYATGEKSNFYGYFSAMLTAPELAAWEAATPEDPWDGSAVQGRYFNVKISHSKGGWPQVEDVIGPAKRTAAKKTKAELKAEAAALLAAAEESE